MEMGAIYYHSDSKNVGDFQSSLFTRTLTLTGLGGLLVMK